MDNIQDIQTSEIDIYNVTRLNREVRAVLEGSFPSVWVQGEISNLAQPASGHIYFSLKDPYSQVRCAMFQNRRRGLKFNPENGSSVLIRANVSLYENRGEYQLIVEHMEAAGEGALQRAFEELKQRLFKEGLFDEKYKQAVPQMPPVIGVITSPTGAAIRDILNVLKRRYPLAAVIVYPAAVQGEAAPAQIISMLQTAERRNECDVLILARGGGSLEDLWAFNNEQLARAIFDCSLPVVTGIGHEIDFTIADFVADHRAPTPSAAAELVSPDQAQLNMNLIQINNKIAQLIIRQLKELKQKIFQLERRLPHPLRTLQQLAQRLDDLNMRSQRAIKILLHQKQGKLDHLQALLSGQNPSRLLQQQLERCKHFHHSLIRLINIHLQQFSDQVRYLSRNLDTVSPLATLNRGYAIVQQQNGNIVRNAAKLGQGEIINTLFAHGKIESAVKKIIQDEK